VVLSFLVMAGCNMGSLTGESESGATSAATTGVTTYQSVWINASWVGGRTGSPLNSQAYGPGSFTGSHCPPNSLILENHSARFKATFSNSQEVLVFKNTCSAPAHLLVCVTAGSGGNYSEFPVCNTDPRTTPISRLAPVDMGPNDNTTLSITWREAGLNLDLNIFYCGVGDSFTLGAVSGAKPTDCLQ
jgi:hypothetical protein